MTDPREATAAAVEQPVVWPDCTTPPAPGELDQFGFSTLRKCPECHAGLYWSTGITTDHFICLNGCHLSLESRRRFAGLMASLKSHHIL